MLKKDVLVTDGGQMVFSELVPAPDDSALEVSSDIIPEWELIASLKQWRKVLPDILTCKEIGLDIETTGLSPHSAEIRLVQIATSSNKVYVIDMRAFTNLAFLTPVLKAKRPVKVMHNAIFELGFLYCKHQLPFEGIFDTMLASQLLGAGISNRSHSLQAVAMRQLRIKLDKRMQTSNWQLPQLTKTQFEYAALDASIMLSLREALIPQLIKHQLINVAKIEFDCTKAVSAMIYKGMKVDQAFLARQRESLEQSQRQLEQTLNAQLGLINFNSPQQVISTLRAHGIPLTSTKEHELQSYVEKAPIIQHLLAYKGVQKQLNTFVRPLLRHTHPHTGRIHPSFHQNSTAAGRMSCSNPNTQNFPRGDFRQVIVPEFGHKLIIADYGQIELRIVAEMAEDETMIKAYQLGQDLHKLTASIITHKPLDHITKDERQKAKAVNFGLIYGMGAEGLVVYAKRSYGVDMTKSEAEHIRNAYFRNYKGLARWQQLMRHQGHTHDYVRTLSGRKRFLEEGNFRVTELYNTPIQGTGADIIKVALVRLHQRFYNGKVDIINCIHDEIVMECPANMALEVAQTVEEEMVAAGEQFLKRVPIEVEVIIADNWAEK